MVERKLNAEPANCCLAMLEIVGLLFQVGLTGSAWGDGALYTGSDYKIASMPSGGVQIFLETLTGNDHACRGGVREGPRCSSYWEEHVPRELERRRPAHAGQAAAEARGCARRPLRPPHVDAGLTYVGWGGGPEGGGGSRSDTVSSPPPKDQ